MMKFLKSSGLYLLAGILIFIYAFSKQGEKITSKQFAAKIKETANAQVVDVRTPEEYKEGYIKSAKNIDWNGDNFDDKAGKLNKSAPVFLYCRSGKRSAAAAKRMKSLGFTSVYDLEGGMSKWAADGMPVQMPKK
jgi:rhodanese-related sulfurtransferase